MRIWKQRKEQVPALLFIVWISPPGYPSAWLRRRRARFRFAQQDHCSSTTSIGLNFRMRHHSFLICISIETDCSRRGAWGDFLRARFWYTASGEQIHDAASRKAFLLRQTWWRV